MEPSRSSHSLYGTVNAMKARGILDKILMVPPMTPTVSTLAPFGATNEVAWAIFSRHVSTAAPSICLFTCIFVRRSGQNCSRVWLECGKETWSEMMVGKLEEQT